MDTFTRTIGGREWIFCRPSYDDALALAIEYRRAHKAQLVENLRLLGQSDAQVLVELQAFDRREPSIEDDFYPAMDLPRWRTALVERAYAPSMPPEAGKPAWESADQFFDVLNELTKPFGIGFAAKEKAAGAADPTKPGERPGEKAPSGETGGSASTACSTSSASASQPAS